MRPALLAILVPIALAGCAKTEVCPNVVTAALAEWDALPESTSVAGTPVGIEATLWRDFMPSRGTEGSCLFGSVIPTPGGPVPLGLAADSIVVVMGDLAWRVDRGTPFSNGGRAGLTFEGGPRWGPGVNVDVIARITATGTPPALVRHRDVPITRTE